MKDVSSIPAEAARRFDVPVGDGVTIAAYELKDVQRRAGSLVGHANGFSAGSYLPLLQLLSNASTSLPTMFAARAPLQPAGTFTKTVAFDRSRTTWSVSRTPSRPRRAAGRFTSLATPSLPRRCYLGGGLDLPLGGPSPPSTQHCVHRIIKMSWTRTTQNNLRWQTERVGAGNISIARGVSRRHVAPARLRLFAGDARGALPGDAPPPAQWRGRLGAQLSARDRGQHLRRRRPNHGPLRQPSKLPGPGTFGGADSAAPAALDRPAARSICEQITDARYTK